MYKLAIIGDSDSILAFKAINFESFKAHPENVESILREKYYSGKYAIIFLSETLAEHIKELLDEFGKQPFPVITILPISRELKNIGMKRMKDTCIKATGTDIISKLK